MRRYFLALNETGRLVDGPWGYDEGADAQAAETRYLARVSDQNGLQPLVLEGASLDEIVAARPDIFALKDDPLPLRGPHLLQTVERRARMFTPSGLAPSAPMTDEDVLVLVQQQIRRLNVTAAAPAAVREQVSSLCNLAIYAAFVYDFNHVVVTMAALAHELVLGVKFVEAYGGRIPLRNRKTGEEVTLEVALFTQVNKAIERGGSHPRSKGWELQGSPAFRATLGGLVHWAHERGFFAEWLEQLWARVRWNVATIELTRTQDERWTPPDYDTWPDDARAAWWEDGGRQKWELDYLSTIPGIRNNVAHPAMHAITSPVDASRAISRLVEFVGRLWPADPPRRSSPSA